MATGTTPSTLYLLLNKADLKLTKKELADLDDELVSPIKGAMVMAEGAIDKLIKKAVIVVNYLQSLANGSPDLLNQANETLHSDLTQNLSKYAGIFLQATIVLYLSSSMQQKCRIFSAAFEPEQTTNNVNDSEFKLISERTDIHKPSDNTAASQAQMLETIAYLIQHHNSNFNFRFRDAFHIPIHYYTSPVIAQMTHLTSQKYELHNSTLVFVSAFEGIVKKLSGSTMSAIEQKAYLLKTPILKIFSAGNNPTNIDGHLASLSLFVNKNRDHQIDPAIFSDIENALSPECRKTIQDIKSCKGINALSTILARPAESGQHGWVNTFFTIRASIERLETFANVLVGNTVKKEMMDLFIDRVLNIYKQPALQFDTDSQNLMIAFSSAVYGMQTPKLAELMHSSISDASTSKQREMIQKISILPFCISSRLIRGGNLTPKSIVTLAQFVCSNDTKGYCDPQFNIARAKVIADVYETLSTAEMTKAGAFEVYDDFIRVRPYEHEARLMQQTEIMLNLEKTYPDVGDQTLAIAMPRF